MHHPFLAYVECFSIHREVYKFFFVGLGGWYSHNVFLSSKTIIHISKSYQNTKILVNVSVTHQLCSFTSFLLLEIPDNFPLSDTFNLNSTP